MAVTATAVPGIASTSQFRRAWDIIATADADTTTGNIAHGLLMPDPTNDPNRRVVVTLEPLGAKFYTQNWFKASIDGTNIVLTKSSTAASTGDAAAQVRLHVEVRLDSYA
jgi:hypothetical protein